MEAVGCAGNLQEYEKLLCLKPSDGGIEPGELQMLSETVLQIDISRFFRTGSMWQYLLAFVMPELLRRCAEKGDPCRCWVMGAGLGEEVYSLKACWELGLNHVMKDGECNEEGRRKKPHLQIVVSEISRDGLSFARAGDYAAAQGPLKKCKQGAWAAWDSSGAETFREVPEPWLSQMFSAQARGSMRISKRLRSHISWRCESWDAPLSSSDWLDEVGGPFHLILGRHGPFFYPGLAAQKQLLDFIATSALETGGYLAVGRDESKRFAQKIAAGQPGLVCEKRPSCVCGQGEGLPSSYFRAPHVHKKKRAASASVCSLCGPQLGQPGRMLWKKS